MNINTDEHDCNECPESGHCVTEILVRFFTDYPEEKDMLLDMANSLVSPENKLLVAAAVEIAASHEGINDSVAKELIGFAFMLGYIKGKGIDIPLNITPGIHHKAAMRQLAIQELISRATSLGSTISKD